MDGNGGSRDAGRAVTWFDRETAISAAPGGRFLTRLHSAWNIGENPNGGYVMASVLRAMREVAGQPDPLSVTAHFLRPALADAEAEIRTEVIRAGRSVTTVRAELVQQGKPRIAALAVLGDVASAQGVDESFEPPPPVMPPIDQCIHRSRLEQGVEVPLLSRVDVYLRPEQAGLPAPDRKAMLEGWVRLADGGHADTLALPLLLDAFPPSPITRLQNIGWVPTIELTVHVRRRPASGWLVGRLHCDDLSGGRMVESGTLWDASGQVVARSRQLGLIMQR